jgi:hypothetical protein
LKTKSVYTFKSFYNQAGKLRQHFDQRFHDPRVADGGRFIWDYWHVPNQYTHLRTPAYAFFPKPLYEDLHRSLLRFGQQTLGCHDISPPWMSCYLDGHNQNLHADVPHGPWAYVFSLSQPTKKLFTGGETLLLNDHVLDYWNRFGATEQSFYESEQFFQKITPHFNQLTVFDPRIPHGVSPVKGPQDVRHGRLVIHGWFVSPKPFVEGPLPLSRLKNAINDFGEAIHEVLSMGIDASGVISFRIHVAASGTVTKITPLTNSLRSSTPKECQELVREAMGFWKGASFGKCSGPSTVTLPVIFER